MALNYFINITVIIMVLAVRIKIINTKEYSTVDVDQ